MKEVFTMKVEFDGTDKEWWGFVNGLIGLRGMRGVKNMMEVDKLVDKD